MPPRGLSKGGVHKKCPECKKQIPVATRVCPCSYQFFEERRKSTASNNSELEEGDENNENKETKPKATSDSGEHTSSPAIEVKRRSERVKREKPNYYDSLEYDNQMRKARKERQREEQLQNVGRVKRERKIKNNSDLDDDEEDETCKEKRKRKKKKSTNGDSKKEEEIDEDIMTGISPQKEWQYSVVLQDINLKLGFNNPAFF